MAAATNPPCMSMDQFKTIMRELIKEEISSAKLDTISSTLTDIDSTLKDVSDKADKAHATDLLWDF